MTQLATSDTVTTFIETTPVSNCDRFREFFVNPKKSEKLLNIESQKLTNTIRWIKHTLPQNYVSYYCHWKIANNICYTVEGIGYMEFPKVSAIEQLGPYTIVTINNRYILILLTAHILNE